MKEIYLVLNLTLGHVQYALTHPVGPGKKNTGRKLKFSDEKGSELVDCKLSDPPHRRTTLDNIFKLAPEPDIGIAGKKSIRSGLKRKEYK